MYTNEYWAEMEAELKELRELRTEISKRIHILNMGLHSHHKTIANPPDKTDTIAYQMFGKRLRDLTPEELRKYYTSRQRINRAKRKENTK